ncbi:MAG TPA: cytochrome c biogenesis protein ResB [Candidatus Hydrogenedentes bacterium]|nr:cytochrome c biogenesis protein ResB [Candidatus Hydrogenedentota bacterium]
MKKILRAVFQVLASSALACVLLILLMAVTFVGTLEQVDLGIYEVKRRYFESLITVHWFFNKVPVPLPGVYLLTFLAGVNLVCGGLVRIKKGISQWGVVVAHAAVVILLVGGWVKHEYGEEGYMTLHEAEVSNEFETPLDWEIAIWKKDAAPITEYVIPHRDFAHASQDHPVTFQHPDLPLDIQVTAFFPNCLPQPAGAQTDVPSADGFILQPISEKTKLEEQIPGAVVQLQPKNATAVNVGLLWGAQRGPWVVRSNDETWVVDFRRQRRLLPFAIRLDKFTRELHPRTNLPRAFSSDITRIENGEEFPAKISMNEPLRHKGYTLYQASWGPQNAPEGTRLFSTLAVSYDPAERLPLYSCVVLTAGLVFHFGWMLYRRLRRIAEENAS